MDEINVILVDGQDNQLGVEEKLRAHIGSGILHRAVSVLVFRKRNGNIETLMQKRSHTKIVWPGYWTNTVCTHPLNNEPYTDAGVRRLNEEMGIQVSPGVVRYGYRFEYQAQYTPEFAEHELDTVLFLLWDGEFLPDKNEAEDTKWIVWEALLKDMNLNPGIYTPWFLQIVKNTITNEYIKTI